MKLLNTFARHMCLKWALIKLSIDYIRKTVLSIHFIKCYCSFIYIRKKVNK